ncbi:facilitated trehalose transporter Tret1-2 homolog [Bicyclus anynana]|uniref:Facilitated trehalose transporter Tret1-2 homolog n=1 Tax=Bicyclus anynana TaxID=110368 RepID=A0A6J1MV43_BICAN|nr:facilitated trehalose transporter Tret1-2 homolog [Bicyclus anynana]
MGKLRQAHTSISCALGNTLTGLLYVWPSYTLHLYTSEDTNLLTRPMTDLESSLVGSLPSLGAMLGTAVVGWIMSIFGRQKTALVLAAPLLISWVMIDFTKSSIVILIARFIAGASGCAFLVHSPIYISEVAEESIRGTLASAPMVCYCLGALMSYLIGWFFTYRYIIWINIAFCILYMGLMLTVRESPISLLRQKKEEEARLAIAYYRSASVSSKLVLDEFSRLKQQVTPAVELRAVRTSLKEVEAEKEKLNSEIDETESQEKMSSLKMLFTSPSSRRGFLVVGVFLTLQVMMGMVAVQVYAKEIFKQAAPGLSSHLCSVMFALVLLAGSSMSALFTDKFGRKILLISSAVLVGLCLIGLGVLLHTSIAPPWVSAVLILCYCFAFMFGAGSIPYVLLAECFIPEVQSIASMMLLEWVWLLNFVVIGIFPFMVKFFGIHGTFYAFSCFAIADTIVGLFILPETKGLTNEQIQETFLRGRKK